MHKYLIMNKKNNMIIMRRLLFLLLICYVCVFAVATPNTEHLDLWTAHRACDISDYYVTKAETMTHQDGTLCVNHEQPLTVNALESGSVANGSIVAVTSHVFRYFIENWHPLFREHALVYTLVTFDTDISITNAMGLQQGNEALRRGHMQQWFAVNPSSDFVRNDDMRSRRHAFPLGLPKYDEAVAAFAAARVHLRAAPGRADVPLPAKKHLLAISFSPAENEERRRIHTYYCHNDHVLNASCQIGLSRADYYHFIASAKFVISPRGVGIDCYRTYESLALGTIPIVRRGVLESVYANLPVLFVDDFERDLTVSKLQDIWTQYAQNATTRSRKWQWARLETRYWKNRFRNVSAISVY